jgi:hypothetical protein
MNWSQVINKYSLSATFTSLFDFIYNKGISLFQVFYLLCTVYGTFQSRYDDHFLGQNCPQNSKLLESIEGR